MVGDEVQEEEQNIKGSTLITSPIQAIFVHKITCGFQHCLIICSNKSVMTIGYGPFGELGLGEEGVYIAQCVLLFSCFTEIISVLKANQFLPVKLPTAIGISDVIGVAAGPHHSMISALDREMRSSVFTFGCGAYYRLVCNIVQSTLLAPLAFLLILIVKGLGDDRHRYIPSRVDGLPLYVGSEFLEKGNLDSLITLSCCGLWHSVVVYGCGDLYAWGWNKFHQIGVVSMRAIDESLAEKPHRKALLRRKWFLYLDEWRHWTARSY